MTGDEFYKNAKGYMKINSTMTYIIWSNATEDVERQEKAKLLWLNYLDAKDMRLTAKVWKSIWNGAGKAITVPSEDPRTFDLRYHPEHDTPRSSYGFHRQEKSTPKPRAYRED